jgi:hypothetical protein
MMRRARGKLTYANVMSTIAVFLVLSGGAAYAASQLGKNSVGAKQLMKNAVTTAKVKKEAITAAKVKKGTLTGKQINLSKLGTVPNATHAGSADSIPPAEPIRLIGAPGQPGFESGATNAPGGGGVSFQQAGFYKDAFGIVHLEGLVKRGSSPLVFTLPAGYRPASGTVQVFEQINEGGVFILGAADGPFAAGSVLALKEEVLLGGITYRAGS